MTLASFSAILVTYLVKEKVRFFWCGISASSINSAPPKLQNHLTALKKATFRDLRIIYLSKKITAPAINLAA
jgi:hypothetical protein